MTVSNCNTVDWIFFINVPGRRNRCLITYFLPQPRLSFIRLLTVSFHKPRCQRCIWEDMYKCEDTLLLCWDIKWIFLCRQNFTFLQESKRNVTPLRVRVNSNKSSNRYIIYKDFRTVSETMDFYLNILIGCSWIYILFLFFFFYNRIYSPEVFQVPFTHKKYIYFYLHT